MKAHNIKVVLSFAGEQRLEAETIAKCLSHAGIKIFYDRYEKANLWGKNLYRHLSNIYQNESDYCLILSSKEYAEKVWTNLELQAAQARALQEKGNEYILPVQFDDTPIPGIPLTIGYLDYHVEGPAGICAAFLEKIGYKRSRSRSGQTSFGIPKQLSAFDTAYILLRLDQFPNGVWGASLEKTAALFGHKHDPGSISVSTDASIAISYFTCSQTPEPVKRYQDYLFNRQSSNGAFGMLRQLGTERFPRHKVLQHSRHTATALKFLLHFHGSKLREAEKAMSFLVNHRTPSGWWVDIGSLRDDNSDPLTVAFVVDAFENSREHQWKSVTGSQIDRMLTVGLDYLFKCKWRTEEGWIYKIGSPRDRDLILSNTYVYTGDVLSSIAASCLRLKRHLPELKSLISPLLKRALSNGGVGSARTDQSLNLDPTMTLLEAAIQITAFRRSTTQVFSDILRTHHKSGIMKRSTANGWASLLYLGYRLGYLPETSERHMIQLENLVKQLVREGYPAGSSSKLFHSVELVLRRILSIQNSNRDHFLAAQGFGGN